MELAINKELDKFDFPNECPSSKAILKNTNPNKGDTSTPLLESPFTVTYEQSYNPFFLHSLDKRLCVVTMIKYVQSTSVVCMVVITRIVTIMKEGDITCSR